MATSNVTEENFDTTVSEGTVLVDFWAAWCGPCRTFAPVFEKSSEKHPDITFAKVDTEEAQQLSSQLGIMSIPTLMAFRDGILLYAQPGALPSASLEELIGKLREVDMDDVRRQIAEKEAQEAESAQGAVS